MANKTWDWVLNQKMGDILESNTGKSEGQINDAIKDEVTARIIRNLKASETDIKNIANAVIKRYEEQLWLHVKKEIFDKITTDIRNMLDNKDKVAQNIVDGIISMFKNLMTDNVDSRSFKNYVTLADMCETNNTKQTNNTKHGKMGGGKSHKKKCTRKTTRKYNKRKTIRLKWGGEQNLDVSRYINAPVICDNVRSLIEETSTELNSQITRENQQEKLEEIKINLVGACLNATNKIAEDLGKNAIGYEDLKNILQYFILEMTNLVKQNINATSICSTTTEISE